MRNSARGLNSARAECKQGSIDETVYNLSKLHNEKFTQVWRAIFAFMMMKRNSI
jgi:hypothetical protein